MNYNELQVGDTYTKYTPIGIKTFVVVEIVNLGEGAFAIRGKEVRENASS